MKQTYITPASYGVRNIVSGEKNDCSVRALANTGAMNYMEAHEFMRSFGRVNGHGLKFSKIHEAYITAGFKLVGTFGTTGLGAFLGHIAGVEKQKQGVVLHRALSCLNEGKFIVAVRGHVFAVVDGEVIDTVYNRANMRVCAIYKLED